MAKHKHNFNGTLTSTHTNRTPQLLKIIVFIAVLFVGSQFFITYTYYQYFDSPSTSSTLDDDVIEQRLYYDFYGDIDSLTPQQKEQQPQVLKAGQRPTRIKTKSSRSTNISGIRNTNNNSNSHSSPTATTTDIRPTLVYPQTDEICPHRESNAVEYYWQKLCNYGIINSSNALIKEGKKIKIVQIGAHTGYEKNDPIAHGLTSLIKGYSHLDVAHNNEDMTRKFRQERFQWTFIEPSPPNYERLLQNLAKPKHSDLCSLHSINAAILPDGDFNSDTDTDTDTSHGADHAHVTFYTMRDTIDPETGFDSLSNKKFPYWVTQVSSLDREVITSRCCTSKPFKQMGLDINDYIVAKNVTAMEYSKLIKNIMTENGTVDESVSKILLLLIDTEGFDCKIINGIDMKSSYRPQYIIFEKKHCNKRDFEESIKHLEEMGYFVESLPKRDNDIAIYNYHDP
jgi:hypothetical protein